MTPLDTVLEHTLRETPIEGLPAFLGTLATMQARAQLKMLTGPAPVVREVEALLTVCEVAKQLNLSAYTVYELCRQGLIPSHKCGKSVRIAPSAVAEYLAQQRP